MEQKTDRRHGPRPKEVRDRISQSQHERWLQRKAERASLIESAHAAIERIRPLLERR